MNLSPPSNTLSMASPFHPNQTSPPGTTTATNTNTNTCTVPPLSLSRYDSAPGSFLSTLVTSSDHHPTAASAAAAGPSHSHSHGGALFGRFFPGESSSSSPSMTSDSSCKVGPTDQRQHHFAPGSSHEAENHDPNLLVRHSSSPAGFFSNLLMDNYPPNANNKRLKSQLSFTRQSTLSQISEDEIPDLGGSIGGSGAHSDETRPYGFSIGSWDDTNSIIFSANKRGKDNSGDIITNLSNIDSQFFPRTSLEMGSVEKYLQIQQDQVPFKVRAKRGCATHPRSIAERERRTRISEKLRKLQDLVPNMDKQTSTADMLDLAVQHIKVLQNQVEILKQEQDKCTCGSHRKK
ncbi:Basic helix-loop-helix (BHLH) DNA-binding superfamily [Rhynchospora pubera]|uniref:Basic helix-loop-helix (BHLH) DNA-binding superfamily n=1 Tax=Rhynchospora pubera TaxID=906938 RepID=A0AAV8D298_9POAL|nr:Basic helix-loop-helix (BHLH) DNA-binding superfamily [Rhynchospora pubera]